MPSPLNLRLTAAVCTVRKTQLCEWKVGGRSTGELTAYLEKKLLPMEQTATQFLVERDALKWGKGKVRPEMQALAGKIQGLRASRFESFNDRLAREAASLVGERGGV